MTNQPTAPQRDLRAPLPPPRKRMSFGRQFFIACVAVAAMGIAVFTATGGGQGTGGGSGPATVTYVVSGDTADVTYGPAGSSLSGTSPMQVTQQLGAAAYYAITAQLQGGGEVSCQIKVGGQVVSQGTATGGYHIAQCEISQDPGSGDWVSDTG